jgi:hypothetical protein
VGKPTIVSITATSLGMLMRGLSAG